VRRLLAEQHISDEALVLENGCGLSRRERVSARLLGQVLLNAARGPYGNELLATCHWPAKTARSSAALPAPARVCA
jgi:D-alanyl-D-alanine carboxypeptidase/D-alanyl-D-alanine-endopeptidase (penicillin-binding protein 4)